jgi:heme-degrading monooxygenase HmoA
MAIVTVFRSRLRPEALEAYRLVAQRMAELVETMEGFEGSSYYSNGADRVTIVRFRDEACQAAWATHPEHVAAKERGRHEFYESYELTVATETLHYAFDFGAEH